MRATELALKKVTLTSLFAFWVLSGCASQQQQDEEDLEIADDQQGSVNDEEANESNSEGNFEDDQQAENQENNEESSEINNDTENDTQTAEDPALENPPAENPTAVNPTAVAEPPPAEPAPTNTTAAAPAPAAGGEGAPVPGGRVRYVKSGTQIVNSPGGSPVASLTQGDHPVTWEENGWLRIHTGMYVPVDAMSDAGVPRPMSGAIFSK